MDDLYIKGSLLYLAELDILKYCYILTLYYYCVGCRDDGYSKVDAIYTVGDKTVVQILGS